MKDWSHHPEWVGGKKEPISPNKAKYFDQHYAFRIVTRRRNNFTIGHPATINSNISATFTNNSSNMSGSRTTKNIDDNGVNKDK